MDDRASTRPKRPTHPPRHYDEYEMGFVPPQRQLSEPIISRHGQEEELRSQEEGAAMMTPRTFDRRQSLRDAGYLVEQHIAVGQYSLRPGSEFQLATQYTERAQVGRGRVSPPSSRSSVQYDLPPASRNDLLQSRDEHLDAALAEIRETRSELRLLAETVRSLKQTPQPATVCSQSNTLDPRKSDQLSSLPLDHEARAPPVEKLSTNVQVNQYGNADQPDPPTGPETEDPQPQAVSSEPIVDILDKMMSELQVLKQAAVSKSRPLVAHTQSPRIVKDGPSTAKTSKPLPDLSSQQDFQSQPPPRTSSAYNSEQHKSYPQGEPATTSQPYLPMRAYPRTVIDPRPQILPPSEPSYRGPMPSIPYFSRRDPIIADV
ncbi:hypothetical protein Q8A67_004023 [Cirrhinus molitorella]|uniref:Uncharacterized protein n=1 Tax=Cirrhinus molitorella TaxID=172907 RepID=A0AA88QBY7_9TELE|nr:hypothetical protein Q8A67_004023 [Cirrhinus molitorella]